MKPLDKLESIDFLPYLHDTFCIRLAEIEPIELELVSVTEAGTRARPELRQPFSIHFLGPMSAQYLLQHIYHLEHPRLGEFDLFLVPLGPEGGRMRYEAILT